MDYVMKRSGVATTASRVALVVGAHVVLLIAFGMALGGLYVTVKPPPRPIDFVPVIEPTQPQEPVKPLRKPTFSTPMPLVPIEEIVVLEPTPPVERTSAVALPTTPTTPDAPAGVPAPMPAGESSSAPAPTSAASVGVACPNAAGVRAAVVYPRAALRDGIEGEVLVRFIVGADGALRDIHVAQSSDRVFNHAALAAVQRFQCRGQGQDVLVEVPFAFTLK